jgi:hypothetical protein
MRIIGLTARVEAVVVVHEVVGRVDDGHDGRLAGDGDVEGALLEWQKTAVAVARALREHPQLDVALGHHLGRAVQLAVRLFRVEAVDEDDAGQPGARAERPHAQHLFFGHGGDAVRPRPEPEHAQNVERALVVGHHHATPLLRQDLLAANLPFDAHRVRDEAQNTRPVTETRISEVEHFGENNFCS